MGDLSILYLLGYVDTNGLVHHAVVYWADLDWKDHRHFFPGQFRKLWRFYPAIGKVEESMLTREALTQADYFEIESRLGWMMTEGCQRAPTL